MRLGSDPEVFLLDEHNNPISVIGLIGADKWNPLQMFDMPEGFTLQEDNVAMEFGIPPAASAEEFYRHIDMVMKESLKYVATGIKFSKVSCLMFPKEQMEHPLAHVFGCEPDFNAWTQKENPRPKPAHEFLRSAGGHIHIETLDDPWWTVKKADLYIGVPLVLMEGEEGHKRKAAYGKAGACRVKAYGVEYRSPSNWWTAPGEDKHRQARCEWVYRNMQRAVESKMVVDDLEEVINKCINDNDAGLAQALINHYELEVL